MTILALDTASHKSGYAIYQDGEIITSGSIRLKGKGETDTEHTQSRVIDLSHKVGNLINKYGVVQVVAEDIHYSDKTHSAFNVLGTCRGAIWVINDISGLPPVATVNPLQAKAQMWGYNGSRQAHREMKRSKQKALMCRAVEKLGYTLNHDRNGNPDNDQADAIGLLITYLKAHKYTITHPNANTAQ